MKKLISLICIVAMMFTVSAFTASAADNEIYVKATVNGSEVTLGVYVKTDATHDVSAFSAYFDVSAIEAAGGTLKVFEKYDEENDEYTYNEFSFRNSAASTSNVKNGIMNVVYANASGKIGNNKDLRIFEVVYENVPTDKQFTLVPYSDVERIYKVQDSKKNVTTADFAQPEIVVTMGDYVAGDVDKGYKDLDATVTTATGEYLDKENNIKTDWQVGTGFKAEFVVPAALDSMKWAATIDNDKMYSSKYDLTGFEGIEVGSSVVLYSAYTNGAWVGNGFEKTDATKDVKDAGIILKDADGVFYASEGAIAE